MLAGDEGLDKSAQFIRTYFKMDGHRTQINVSDASTLWAGHQNPDGYRYLIVRVAGTIDYFCDLSPALQDEIIACAEPKIIWTMLWAPWSDLAHR